ncbi:MAG TPA: SMP-30/gluconolactonase/LRE family protein [Solirubrobacteraceae bacterium]|nr:SMP-30/gluconolactonase/LRE family protein [Solirubrobacteraceae bacterium]
MAIDQETGNVYVANGGPETVDVFGKEGGVPAGGVPATIAAGFSFGLEPAEVAIDNACYYHEPRLTGGACAAFDPSNGDVYVANVRGNAIDKLRLNTVSKEYEVIQEFRGFGGGGEPDGVAVDQQGNVYVADYHEQAITELNSEANATEVGQIEQHTVEHPAFVAAGGPGVLYVGGYQNTGVVKLEFDTTTHLVEHETLLDGNGGAVAVDGHGNVYVDEGGGISEYDSSGKFTGQFQFDAGRQIGGGEGVAVNNESGDLYAGNLAYGALVAEPEPITEGPSNVEKTTATLHGTVNPGGEAATYYFEYGPCPEGTGSCAGAGYPSRTSEGMVGAAKEDEPMPVEAVVAGLAAGTAYHVRLVALNAGTPKQTGAEVVFETVLGVAGVGRCAASENGIEAHGATVEAPLNPSVGELPVEYRFEYGTSVPPRATEPYEHKTGAQEVTDAAQIGIVTAVLPGAMGSPLVPNTTYHCRLVAAAEGAEAFGADNTFTTSPAPPKSEAVSATPGSTPRTSELLSGRVDPENSATTYQFAYIDQAESATGHAWIVTPAAGAGAGSVPTPVGPVRIAGLRAGATYEYKLIATNSFDERETSKDQTFTTAPATLPRVGAGQVSGITQTAATVSGAIDPQGLPTAYELQLTTTVVCRHGETPCAGAEASYSGAPIFGTLAPGREAIEVGLEDLTPATTYHYRIVATNEDGTEYGPDATFTTLGVPSPITQPLATPLIATPSIAFPNAGKPTNALTSARKLKQALATCRKKHSKKKRTICEKRAHMRDGPAKGKS